MTDKKETKKEVVISTKLEVRKTTSGYQFWNGADYVGAIGGENITPEQAQERAKQIETKLGL